MMHKVIYDALLSILGEEKQHEVLDTLDENGWEIVPRDLILRIALVFDDISGKKRLSEKQLQLQLNLLQDQIKYFMQFIKEDEIEEFNSSESSQ